VVVVLISGASLSQFLLLLLLPVRDKKRWKKNLFAGELIQVLIPPSSCGCVFAQQL
jgi:hypothetical protein